MKRILLTTLAVILCLGTITINAEDIQLTPKEQIIKRIIASNYSYTPTGFFQAIGNGNLDCVNLFLKAGFDPNTTNMTMPAIYFAVIEKQPKIVDRLLNAGVDPNTNFKGRTILYQAIATKNVETVKALIKHGVNVNEQSWGETPINYAVKKKNEDIVTLLLNSGAKIDNETLKYALKSKNSEIKNAVLYKYKKQ